MNEQPKDFPVRESLQIKESLGGLMLVKKIEGHRDQIITLNREQREQLKEVLREG